MASAPAEIRSIHGLTPRDGFYSASFLDIFEYRREDPAESLQPVARHKPIRAGTNNYAAAGGLLLTDVAIARHLDRERRGTDVSPNAHPSPGLPLTDVLVARHPSAGRPPSDLSAVRSRSLWFVVTYVSSVFRYPCIRSVPTVGVPSHDEKPKEKPRLRDDGGGAMLVTPTGLEPMFSA
jgi:hypothetical protein